MWIHFKTQANIKWESVSDLKMVICGNESWNNKNIHWQSIRSYINQLFSYVCVCVFDRLLIDWSDSSEDERVKRGVDPDLSSPRPSPAATTTKARPALNVSYVYMYCLPMCALMCLCARPAALCALTFTEALSGPINSQAVPWPFTPRTAVSLRPEGVRGHRLRKCGQQMSYTFTLRRLMLENWYPIKAVKSGMKTQHHALKIKR